MEERLAIFFYEMFCNGLTGVLRYHTYCGSEGEVFDGWEASR